MNFLNLILDNIILNIYLKINIFEFTKKFPPAFINHFVKTLLIIQIKDLNKIYISHIK